MGKTIYEYQPVGVDLWDGRTGLDRGARVVKTQPAGCPKNGTMGHTFVADAETGKFVGLVLTASLRKAAKSPRPLFDANSDNPLEASIARLRAEEVEATR